MKDKDTSFPPGYFLGLMFQGIAAELDQYLSENLLWLRIGASLF